MKGSVPRNTAGNALVSGWSPRKYRRFSLFSIFLGVSISLVSVEMLLRYEERRIAQSEQMQQGLMLYDAELGWKLKPGWAGRHRHHDFDVQYGIDRSGFRAGAQGRSTDRRIAVLGDSFAFGLGVADDDTFVSLLNTGGGTHTRYLNLAVPGYSTDQEYILFKQIAASVAPDVVLLVVYLGNDLIDNQLPFPMQADYAKPFFRLGRDGALVAANTPVPRDSKSAVARETDLGTIVFGDAKPSAPLLTRTFGRLAISRRLGLFQHQGAVPDGIFRERFDPAIDLFLALAGALHSASREVGADLTIALLPGVSFIERPHSLSARYQDYLRQRLVEAIEDVPDISIIDLATSMRVASEDANWRWYFPNEGHLTPQGHRYVAGILARELPR